jgi:hypothetical protein
MKEMGDTHWWEPNEALLTAVVLQVFREGIVTTMVHSTTLAATVTGGVLRRTILQTPGTATCITHNGDVYRDNAIRLSVSVRCLRDSLWPLTL